MNRFIDIHPDATLEDRISIHEFVNQNEVSGIIFDILELRGLVTSLICESYTNQGYFKKSARLEVVNDPQHRELFANLDNLVIELFDIVLPSLFPNKSLVQAVLEKSRNDRIIKSKFKLNALFAILVIEDTDLANILKSIIDINSITSGEYSNDDLNERRIKKLNQKIYTTLIEIRSELTNI